MRKACGRGARSTGFAVVVTFLASTGAQAHVVLDSPLGGESLIGGFPFTVEWRVTDPHDTENWDLWYSTSGSQGPWLDIATDLPMGDISFGAQHSFVWLVPNMDIPAAWVRVRQDNGSTDYYSVSNTSFSISLPAIGDFNGNGVVNGGDLAIWRSGYGTQSGASFTDGDDDGDGDVDGTDFMNWQRNQGHGSSLTAVSNIPEPATLILFLFSLGYASALVYRRSSN